MYEEFFKYTHLQPVNIKNKEYYYKLINDLSDSFTSRLIGNFFHSANINLIISELCQLLTNSIELYEKGYFDNAYYSLRSANELATIMLDLSDKDSDTINKNMKLFLTKEYHKNRGQIIKELSNEGIMFKEVINKMPNFKEEIKNLLSEINQVIHMNGKENLYGFREYLDSNFHEVKLKKFENHFLSSIKILAIFILIIDPLPLLLNDEEVYYRCPNLLTEPFSQELLSVIGEKSILEFEQTENYISMKNQLLKMEKRKPAVNDYVFMNILDLEHMDDIYSQKHLLNEFQQKCLEIVYRCNKITEIRTNNGFNRCTITPKSSNYICNVLTDEEMKNIKGNFNNNYNNIFVSILGTFNDLDITPKSELIYVFHEEKLNNDEIISLKEMFIN